MLTQLSTVKSRLALTVTDYDDLLTNAIKAISARFDKETNRTLSRTTTATHEFDAADTEILATLLLWNLKVWNFAVAASCFSNGEGLSIAVI